MFENCVRAEADGCVEESAGCLGGEHHCCGDIILNILGAEKCYGDLEILGG